MKSFKQFITEMKSFKQFLLEAWTNGLTASYHNEKVAGHQVDIEARRNRQGRTEIGYRVDGHHSVDDAFVHQSKRVLIARHAAVKIKEFVATKKPQAVQFSTYNDVHQKAFHKFATKLAQDHGYRHQHYGGNLHVLTRKD